MELALAASMAQLNADKSIGKIAIGGPSSGADPSTRTYSAIASQQVLTQAVISQEFLEFYDPSHRDEAKEAREKLLRKECTMIQHPTVKVYEQQFKILVRKAVDMPATDQIAWFLHGLSPTLKHLCIVDHTGKDWRSLPDLIDFALGAELRHQAQTDNDSL
eukprot:gene29711-biopygen4332